MSRLQGGVHDDSEASSPRADVLLVNARVLTMDPRRPTAEAVAIRGERVLAVGCRGELQHLAGTSTEVVDAEGGLAIPGIHDAHMHLRSWARRRSWLDCRDLRSVHELQAAIRNLRHPNPRVPGSAALGSTSGRSSTDGCPDRCDLDAAAAHQPVRLRAPHHAPRHSEHGRTAATRALDYGAPRSGARPRSRAIRRDGSTTPPTCCMKNWTVRSSRTWPKTSDWLRTSSSHGA